MTEWHEIDGDNPAPRDGTEIHAKRVFEGRFVWEGPAVWRTVHFGALTDPLSGEEFSKAHDATGWMMPDVEKRVPTPTHWSPPPTDSED